MSARRVSGFGKKIPAVAVQQPVAEVDLSHEGRARRVPLRVADINTIPRRRRERTPSSSRVFGNIGP
jgi:hypothetical protein